MYITCPATNDHPVNLVDKGALTYEIVHQNDNGFQNLSTQLYEVLDLLFLFFLFTKYVNYQFNSQIAIVFETSCAERGGSVVKCRTPGFEA